MAKRKKSSAKPKKVEEILPADEQAPKEEMFYQAIGHVIRRKIIQYVGDHEKAGFSNFKTATEASTGTIYHHLDILKDLLAQDKKKKYHLTLLGEHAYRFLSHNLDSLESAESTEKIVEENPNPSLIDILTFRKQFQYSLENPKRGIMLSHLIVIIVSVLGALFGIRSYLYFYSPVEAELNFVFHDIQYGFFFYGLLSFYVLFILTEALCRLLFNKTDNWMGLLSVIGFSFIPMLFYNIFIIILGQYEIPEFQLISRIFLIIFQVWAMIVLAHAISITKYIRFERGLIIAIFIDYSTFMLILLLNSEIL